MGRTLPQESQPIIFRLAPTLCGDQSFLYLNILFCFLFCFNWLIQVPGFVMEPWIPILYLLWNVKADREIKGIPKESAVCRDLDSLEMLEWTDSKATEVFKTISFWYTLWYQLDISFFLSHALLTKSLLHATSSLGFQPRFENSEIESVLVAWARGLVKNNSCSQSWPSSSQTWIAPVVI